MARTSADGSPQLYARVGGLLYLIIIVAGIAGDLVMHLCDVGVMLVFYVLLSSVSRTTCQSCSAS